MAALQRMATSVHFPNLLDSFIIFLPPNAYLRQITSNLLGSLPVVKVLIHNKFRRLPMVT